jgi:hypothetical protein
MYSVCMFSRYAYELHQRVRSFHGISFCFPEQDQRLIYLSVRYFHGSTSSAFTRLSLV